jgi:hypothetical protein
MYHRVPRRRCSWLHTRTSPAVQKNELPGMKSRVRTKCRIFRKTPLHYGLENLYPSRSATERRCRNGEPVTSDGKTAAWLAQGTDPPSPKDQKVYPQEDLVQVICSLCSVFVIELILMEGILGPRLQRQVDPDFDRSLPIKGIPAVLDRPEETGHRTPKRLFNPDRDDATKFNPQMSSPVGTGPRLNDEGQPSGWRREPRRDSKVRPAAIKGEQQLVATAQRNELAVSGPVDADVLPAAETSQETDFVESEERLKMIREPDTCPISQEQLIAEVKGIYVGLVMVEKKCSEVDAKQHLATLEMDGGQPKLTREQWLALIALHRTLLHEHHDFFLASQHPSASTSLKRLAQKHSMPARMWRHGIHSFLELLRHRLPDSLEHMLTFVHLAYSMVALRKDPVHSNRTPLIR